MKSANGTPLVSPFSVSSSSGEFSVLTSPASLEFKGDETLDSSLVGDVVLSALGHSIESQENWNGLFIRNPFQLPKTAVVFLVDGVDTVKSDAIKGHSYPLSGNAHSLDAVAGRLTHSLTIDLENNEEAVSQLLVTLPPSHLHLRFLPGPRHLGDLRRDQARRPEAERIRTEAQCQC